MRDKARKMGLHPRLVVAPDWTNIPKVTESRASMVAYYSAASRCPFTADACPRG